MASSVLSCLRAVGIFLVVLVVTACGGGGGETAPGDTTPPTVVSITPANGAVGVLTNADISVLFSEAMQCPQVVTHGTFGVITGSLACVSANSAGQGLWTLIPDNPFSEGVHYTYSFSGYTDLAGNVGVAVTGGFTVVAAVPPGDTTPPTVLAVTPSDGATDVALTTKPAVTFAESVTCVPGKPATLTSALHTVVGMTTCSGAVLTFAPSQDLANDEAYTFTIPAGAVADLAGNVLAVAKVAHFTTEALPVMDTKVVVANGSGGVTEVGGNGELSFINTGNWTVESRVVFPPAPGHVGCEVVDVDVAKGGIYCGGHITFGILRTDLGGTPLPALTSGFDRAQTVMGLAHSDSEVCTILGRLGEQDSNPMSGVLNCWDRTGVPSFQSALYLTASAGYYPTGMLYSATHRKFYVVSAVESSLLGGQVVDGYKRRPDYLPGTVGTLAEIDPVTHLVTGRWAVGSAPRGLLEVNGKVVVPNAGDGTFSVVTPGNSTVQTIDVSAKLTGL
ncbi:MAG: Ig-like domain-containing protein, partial [Candidatus Moranbacteria bacterium]|nr:Ig-like domain-containing protein [Candidatus Moranbacteria bacterium]